MPTRRSPIDPTRALTSALLGAAFWIALTGAASAQTQLANPAANFCSERGGTYEIVNEASGARGDCILADGRRIDGWEFFRDQTTGGTTPQRLANPAAVHCVEQGGHFGVNKGPLGDRGECILADGQKVDAWQYYRQSKE